MDVPHVMHKMGICSVIELFDNIDIQGMKSYC